MSCQHRCVFAQLAIGQDREDSDSARRVVGDEKELTGLVEGEIARIFAERGKLVEQSELAGLRIESEGADGALLAGFIDSVGVFAVGMNHHERGVRRFRGDSLWR